MSALIKGREAARARAELLAAGCGDVRILDLAPDRHDGFDVSDWLADGNSADKLVALVEQAERIVAGVETRATVKAKGTSQADLLVELAEELKINFVHTTAMVGYAIVPQGNVNVVHRIRSKAYKSLMAKAFYKRYGKAPRAAAMQDAWLVFEGRALHDGRLVAIALRVAGDDEAIDVDLGDDGWRMVHVTRDRWSVEPHGDRLFERAPGMLALPAPVRGGTLADLRKFIRADEDGYSLIAAYLTNCLRPRGPYPVLVLTGEQGSAKTTTARILRRLIDPNKADMRAEPRDTRDLAIAASNAHVVALDNVSHLSAQLSDSLCRLSTGGGFATRTLYTDDEETIFDAQKPIILTSIIDVVSRPDLLERSLAVRLPPIDEMERRTERALWLEFEAVRPRLFGALLDAVSVALRNMHEIERTASQKARMADAFCFALAATPEGDRPILKSAWFRTRDDAHSSTLESSVIAGPLGALVDNGGTWVGTASELLTALAGLATETTVRRREWPKTARALAGQIRIIGPALRAVGIDHEERREPQSGRRLHEFTLAEISRGDSSRPSPPTSNALDQAKLGDRLASLTREQRHVSVTEDAAPRTLSDDGDDGDDDILVLDDCDGVLTGDR